ncbi:transmembrane cell adhesion receptor mua-3-like isoform X2 [Ruditapes philippinarum]|uniref:transmembrane cell adhesion receptor mua-3-like isoform X2 n=1 Tax=Ruditapes philippinarum TaxID=129788 RepID=UPI00295B3662|nr:transmembrane cell adhesion receptor mua-3-like isoform X2 [Ruditapes philippinarum]
MGIPGIMRHAYIAILLMNLVLRGGSVTDICQTATADIVFIVDSSGSVGSSGYDDEIDFIKAIVNELVIDPNEVRMGLIDYSTSVHTSLGFNLNDPNFDTNAEVIAKLNSLPYSGGSTRTDLAIQAAKNMFSGPGNRPDVPDVLFTLTDGETNDGGQDLLDDRVDELKAMFPDLTSIAVGVKDFDIYELNYIASDRSLIFTVDNFDDLDTILDLVLQEICTPPPPEVCVGENCTTTDQCKDDNAVCDQAEGICLCAHGFILDQKGNCVDCHSIDFTTFLTSFPCDGISFCGANQVLIGDTCYGTKVTETCTTTLNTCTDRHAFCNGTVCDCVDGYHWNGTHCVGSALCDDCSYHPDSCGGDLVCGAESGRCECPPTLPIQYDGECYGTKVTETCTTTLNTCTDCHAFCNGTVCDCVDGYHWNGTHCVGSALCDECSYHPDSCGGDLVCGAESGRCECPPALPIQYDGECYGTKVTETCTTTLNTCTDCHAFCNGTVCDCVDGYHWNGTHCVGSALCDDCSYHPDSCGGDLVCGAESGRCECPPALPIQYDGECYGTKVTETCTTTLNTCTDRHAFCNGTVCDCVDGYHWNGTHCVGSALCDECSYHPDSCGGDLVCGAESGRCECPPALPIQYDGECYGTKVTETCTTTLNTCTDCHAFCNGTVCDCVDGYHWNGTHCVGSALCDDCSYHPDSCGGDLVCGAESGRCECPPALPIQYDGECYGTKVTETCTTTLNTCTDRHAFCNGTVCDCVDGYHWNGTHCVGSALCDDCSYHPDSCGGDLVCGAESGRCECPPALPIQYDGECYGTRVTERCPGGLNTCTDCNAYCNGTVCICFDGFYWNGSRCVGSQIDEPCEASPDSCATNGLVCGPTYRCECPYFDVQFENECYALTCGECQADSDCLDPNQICVVDGEATICVCKNDYYLDYCGICSPRLSNGSDCSCDDQCLSGYCICGICEHTDEGDCCNDCTDFRSDIVFVTDASGSVKTANYQKIKAFVIALGNAFQISDIDTRIGLVDYSYAINYVYPLDAFNDNFDFTLSICSQPYSSGTTRTDLGLAEARSILLDSANRPTIPNFVIVITDGMTTEPYATNNLPTEIALLKAVPDTTIFAIGIGDFDTSELFDIASAPEYVYTTASFDTLKTLIGQILIAICTSGSSEPPPDK